MDYLSGCLIFKDSALYLDEWIRFHLEVGFNHLYLYDNDSRDDYQSVIRSFVERGQVTLHLWPGLDQQTSVITHCLDTYRNRTRWLAFIDDDEFLFPATENSLLEILPAYEHYAGVAACWLLFGSSGHVTKPDGLATENYRRRAAWIDRHVKCIVDPRKVTGSNIAAHAFHCTEGTFVVDENHRATKGAFAEKGSANIFCLNHYLIKSLEEMRLRRSRVPVEGPTIHSLEQWEAFDRDYNSVEDNRIQRFTDRLKSGQRT